MTSYEQRLIADLRRQHGKAMGKLEARIDRAVARNLDLRSDIVILTKRITDLENLISVITFARGVPPIGGRED